MSRIARGLPAVNPHPADAMRESRPPASPTNTDPLHLRPWLPIVAGERPADQQHMGIILGAIGVEYSAATDEHPDDPLIRRLVQQAYADTPAPPVDTQALLGNVLTRAAQGESQ